MNDYPVLKIHEFGESEDLSIIFLTPNIKNPVSVKFLNCVRSSTIDVRTIAVESSGKGFSFARSWNKGIEAFKERPSKFLVLSHDDIEFASDFLAKMFSFSLSRHSDTILTPISYEGGRIVFPFVDFLPEDFFRMSSIASHIPIFALSLFEGVRHGLNQRYFREHELPVDVNMIKNIPRNTYPRLFPICIMSQSTIDKLSYFDEDFYFGEDTEFTFRALLNGIKFGLIINLSVNHYGSFNVGKRESKKRMEKMEHIHRELVAHRKIWYKYRHYYGEVKNMANTNFFIL